MDTLALPVRSDDHIRGDPDAPVWLLEYGDYECPYCGRVYADLKRLLRAVPDKVSFAFRNFPLIGIHPHALPAALAAESAALQGKFWEMHDALFEHQAALGDDDLMCYAARLGLDLGDFRKGMGAPETLGRVRADLRSGFESGVGGTPTIFINGRRYGGSYEFDILVEVIEAVARGDTYARTVQGPQSKSREKVSL